MFFSDVYDGNLLSNKISLKVKLSKADELPEFLLLILHRIFGIIFTLLI
jgi:hypothetical protein